MTLHAQDPEEIAEIRRSLENLDRRGGIDPTTPVGKWAQACWTLLRHYDQLVEKLSTRAVQMPAGEPKKSGVKSEICSILKQAGGGPMKPSKIREKLSRDMPNNTLYTHLSKMKQAGMVSVEDGMYSLTHDGESVADSFDGQLARGTNAEDEADEKTAEEPQLTGRTALLFDVLKQAEFPLKTGEVTRRVGDKMSYAAVSVCLATMKKNGLIVNDGFGYSLPRREAAELPELDRLKATLVDVYKLLQEALEDGADVLMLVQRGCDAIYDALGDQADRLLPVTANV